MYLFDGALVLHLLDGSGRVFGVSLVPSAVADIESLLAGCFGALYGDVPEALSVSGGSPPEGTDTVVPTDVPVIAAPVRTIAGTPLRTTV